MTVHVINEKQKGNIKEKVTDFFCRKDLSASGFQRMCNRMINFRMRGKK
jgi:hypothetical protein